jgi:hypothetical protein
MKKYSNFINILKVLVPIYENNKKSKPMKKILVTAVRMLEYVSKRKASKAAQEIADRMGIGPLIKYIWEDQTNKNKMNDINRKIFHWEQYYPVEQIIQELVNLEELDEESILSVIKKVKIIWILKSENKKLDKIAKSVRPNPKLAYEKAGIEIV